MLTREQVEAIAHNPLNADWGHILALAEDWLTMHDALRDGISLAALHAWSGAIHVASDREHHALHDEQREALDRRIAELVAAMAELRTRTECGGGK